MKRALTILNETGDVTIISRSEARAAGLSTYFTDSPCSKGHIALRNVSNAMCRDCKSAHNRSDKQRDQIANWRTANSDRCIGYRQKTYKKYEKQRRKYARARYHSDPVRCQEEQRRRKLKNPAAVRAIARVSRTKNKRKYIEKNRHWRAANYEKVLAFNRNYRARRRAAQGSHTAEDIRSILRMQRFRCAYCPTRLSARGNRHVDHIIALSRGGTNDRRNLQILCQPCNNRKSNHDPIDFAQSIGLLL